MRFTGGYPGIVDESEMQKLNWYNRFIFMIHERLSMLMLISFFLLCPGCFKESGVGEKAAEFSPVAWIQSPRLTSSRLKGKVVLIRWWTDECIFCINSADALNDWHEQYADSGLVIIGMYHPKPEPKVCDAEDVRQYALEKQFRFPIAVDDQWKNLKKYWLNGSIKKFTSVSFLIDRHGIIRYIHPGGEYHRDLEEGHEQCVKDYFALQEMIVNCIQTK